MEKYYGKKICNVFGRISEAVRCSITSDTDMTGNL